MIEVFWGCLVGGIVFALVSLIGGHGHGFHHGLHGVHGTQHLHVRGVHFLNPLTIVGAITAFGGAGILLTRYATLEMTSLLVVAVTLALLMSVAVHFLIVRPMDHSETSLGFSTAEYVGMSGLVTVPIPAEGRGQVMVRIGAGNTCEPAASFDDEPIPSGSKVVIVEVRDHTLYVSAVDLH
jgi:membrane protein implicated in regulation of membrane protease activity